VGRTCTLRAQRGEAIDDLRQGQLSLRTLDPLGKR
jgi:hypothetical protein